MTDRELQELQYSWDFWGRPDQQIPSGDWFVWLILAGRGWGKTRTGAEAVIEWHKQGEEHINLAARTSGDIRKTMIEGESGIIAKCPPDIRPKYITSLKELHWPDGRKTLCFSADEPDQGRGPQSSKLWADELAAWPSWELWHNLVMGLRIGKQPQAVVTTTGRRIRILRELLKDPGVIATRGNTLDNKANLSKRFVDYMVDTYEGTELGKQELGGDVLDDHSGAYWVQDVIDDLRRPSHPALTRVVIGVDPAVTANKRSDYVGIVVAGLGIDGHIYVLADLSAKMGPGEWAGRVLWAWENFGAQLIVAETNRGGDLIEHTLREAAEKKLLEIEVLTLNTQEDKGGRAEPVSTRYTKGKIHHVGVLKELEDEMCDWDPTVSKYSPNRVDALVFACVELSPNREPSNPRGAMVAPKQALAPGRGRSNILIPSRGGGFWQSVGLEGLCALQQLQPRLILPPSHQPLWRPSANDAPFGRICSVLGRVVERIDSIAA